MLIACTVPGLTPKCSAMMRTPGLPGAFRASWIRSFSAGANRRPAKPFALSTSPLKRGTDSFLDDRVLELSKDAKHLEHGPAGRGGRVEALLMQKQIDLERMELGQEADEVLQAAAQPIDIPGHDNIELPLGSVPVQGIEGWPLVASLGAASANQEEASKK